MRSGRNWLVWGAALLTLLAAATLTSLSATEGDSEAQGLLLDAHSSADNGALALYLWTKELGRKTEYLEYKPFALGTDDALLVSLEPTTRYEPEQITEVREWVRDGGTLLLAAETPAALHEALGFELDEINLFTGAKPLQPLLQQPPVDNVSAYSSKQIGFDGGVPLLGAATYRREPVLVTERLGAGRVWVLSIPRALSNEKLREADNAKFYLNVLAQSREGTVVFDEWHHGREGAESLRSLLLSERWGWATWYTALVTLLYFLLRGRRLGRPVRLITTRYRSSGEYVRSLASMLRSAGKREYLRAHYSDQWIRALRRAAGLPVAASLQDVQDVAEANTGAPADRMVAAIEALRDGDLDEKRMLRLVAEAEQQRKGLRRRKTW
ncbi:MAG: DUF4350 domain-containing protein [Chloroflexota bacterium]|nr:DUF4350 domain-containing protein [Chloroflexota bacterium]